MLVAPVHPEKLAQYGLTTLEENMRREYIVDTDDAIPVSMLDVDRYCVPQYAMPLAPEDAVLLQVLLSPGLIEVVYVLCISGTTLFIC